MSVKVTTLIDDYEEENKLSREEYQDIYKSAKFCITRTQSKRIFHYMEPAIIISASGMATGGTHSPKSLIYTNAKPTSRCG